MSQRFHPRPSGRTIPVGSGSTDDEVSGRPCGAVGAALPLWWSLGGGGRKAPAARMRQTVRMTDQHSPQGSQPDEENEPARIVVVTQDGMGVSTPGSPGRDGSDEESSNPADLVEQPAKVMRIGSMIKNLLDEVRNAPLDEAGRTRLAEIHRRSIEELKAGLAPELSRSSTGSPCRSARPRPPTPSCGSPRPSWSAGSRGCSTASRPRSSPSRWRPSSSCRVCGAPCPRVTPPRRTRARACPARWVARRAPERPGPASTSDGLLERRISALIGATTLRLRWSAVGR